MTYALDSNIIQYLLKGDARVQGRFLEAIDGSNTYAIAPLVYYEVKRGLKAVNAKAKLNEFDKLCKLGMMGEMDIDVWEQAVNLYVELRNNRKLIEDADLFIASFCMVNGFVLVTNNTRHFERITGLQLEDWAN